MNYYLVSVKDGYYSPPRSRTYLVGAETAGKAIAAAVSSPAVPYWEIWQDKGAGIDRLAADQNLGQDPSPYLKATLLTGEGVVCEIEPLDYAQ